jgi:predicted transcriptional regulator
MEKLTKAQMQYLLSWIGERKEKRSFYHLAIKNNVSKSTVQRTLNVLVSRGFLNQQYDLTGEGEAYVNWYLPRHRSLVGWLCLHDIDRKLAESTAHAWLAVTEDPVVDMLLKNCLVCSICKTLSAEETAAASLEVDLSEYLPEGTYHIDVEFVKDGPNTLEPSMADAAFEKPARLVITKGSSIIEMKRLRVVRFSYRKNNLISGMLKAMEYMVDGKKRKAEVEGDYVRIKASHILWSCSRNELELKGELRIYATCTAGIIHMPKSPAIMKISFSHDPGVSIGTILPIS